MTPDEEEARRRHDRNLLLGRGLAESLAAEAEKIAATFDRLASVHEALAATGHHPLKTQALERAVEERKVAETERRASAWFRSVASGAYQAEASARQQALDQRLPSQ